MDRGVLVVTGASRGIGAATAIAAARQGWRVIVNYRANREAAEAVVKAVGDAGATAIAVAADVGDPAGIETLFAAADGLGPVRGLVNNAGIVGRRARVDEYEPERVERIMRVNLIGPILCAGQAVRRMSRRRGGAGGSIVNVSSVASRLGGSGEYVDYAASKGAIDSFTTGLAREVAEDGIRVNAVRPGIIDTDIHASGGQADRVSRLREFVPMKREGKADEVAAAVVWLLSDAASYVTGTMLDVSGGR